LWNHDKALFGSREIGCCFFIIQEISHRDISGITTKSPYEAALMGEHHVRIESSDFVMRTFALDFFKKTWYNYIIVHKDK